MTTGRPSFLEFRHLGYDLARRCGEVALVVLGAVRCAFVGVFVWPSSDELVGLLVEHRVNGLLLVFLVNLCSPDFTVSSLNDTIALDVARIAA